MTKITFTNKGESSDKERLENFKGLPELDSNQVKELLKDPDSAAFYNTEDGVYSCTILKYNGHDIIFPEPNPVSFYYSLSKGASTDIVKFRNLLDQFYKDKSKLPPNLQNDTVIFSYIFKIGSVGIIFAFSAIEALLNQLIPDDYNVVIKSKKKTKIDIQRSFNFEKKYENVIVEVTGKDRVEYQKEFEIIEQLKDLRNELIHLKNNQEKSTTYYTKIYQDVLDVDLESIIKATKDFCNFYQPNTVIV